MNAEFKVGDRVRVLFYETSDAYEGNLGTVVAVLPQRNGDLFIRVDLDGDTVRQVLFCPDELEAVAS